MIAFYRLSSSTSSPPRPALGCQPVLPCASLDELVEALPIVDLIMVGSDQLADEEVSRELSEIRRAAGTKPIILSTAKTWDNARLLIGVDVNAVVWADDSASTVTRVVTQTLALSLRSLMADAVASLPIASPLLVSAARLAATVRQPFRTAKRLIHELGCKRRTLESHCLRAFGRRFGPRDLIDWMILANAIEDIRRGCSLAHTAQHLGLQADTIRQQARRKAGLTPQELAHAENSIILGFFVREWAARS